MQTYDFFSVTAVKLFFGPRRSKDAIFFSFCDGPQCMMGFNERTRGETYFNFPKYDGIREYFFNGVYVVVERVGSNFSISVNTPVFTSVFENVDGVLIVENHVE